MADLINEFFQRDLSQNELNELGRLLEQSAEEAQRFGDGLEKLYLGTGFPHPKLPKTLKALPHAGGGGGGGLMGGGMAGFGKITLLAVAVAGAGAGGWKVWQALNPPQPAVVAAPTAVPPVPTPTALHSGPLSLPPLPAGPGKKGDELSIFLDAPQKSLVTVRVMDASGNEVRRLFAGFVEKGQWEFKWDGLLSNGDPATPGKYRIEVRSGPKHLSKVIQVKSNSP